MRSENRNIFFIRVKNPITGNSQRLDYIKPIRAAFVRYDAEAKNCYRKKILKEGRPY
jgi:hypothetical protein